ncbi:energy transducer TonB [Terriglobus roseus]|uniref:energy transducer TonB n=1 Tax=Terriglobus roseus TaxID=392734 RepID=UPI001BB03DD1|nr:energy transducer TonB [Terriglobus roseus]
MLQQARELSNLHQPGTASFRLQASFETYDFNGVPDGKGVLSETYLLDGPWQRSILYRDKRSVVTSVDGKVRQITDRGYQTTFAMTRVLDKLFTPVPPAAEMSSYTYRMTSEKAGKLSLRCVVASLPYRGVTVSVAPNAVYCVDADPAIIRLVQGHNGLVFAFNRILRFGSVYLPGDITMMEKGKMRAHVHVDGIVAVPTLKADDMNLPAADTGGPKQIEANVIAGSVLRKVQPKYPEEAKQRHIQGNVVLHAIISKDGAIRDLELISAPDDSLADAAMDAVRQWKYSPYLLAGAPVEVDTTITVNFFFG